MTREAAPAAAPLQALYAPIAAELNEVEQMLGQQLRSEHEFVDQLVRYGCLLGGKRLRPALLLLAAKATGQVGPEHLTLAAVVEMIHTATLVHDDVLDAADTRRHLATVNARWDNQSSVLLGDYLFTHSFYLASTLPTPLACRLIGSATNVVCEGELRQQGSQGNFGLSEQEYLEIIEAKTAELCACSCHLGAHYAGASEDLVHRLAQFGRYLGIAFQIADDLLDVLGDERTTGKSLGTDLAQLKPTLPLIRVLQRTSGSEREALLELLKQEPAERQQGLWPYFERFEAVQYTRDKALWYAQQAREQIAPLAHSPAQQVLQNLTEFVVSRSE